MALLLGSALRGTPLPISHGPRVCRNRARTAYVAPLAAQAQAAVKAEQQAGAGKSKIYVGKGRFIEDDPKKYPDRTTLTGGFAGGEVGLKQFVSEVFPSKQQPKGSAAPAKASRPAKGGLYIGKGKWRADAGDNESRVVRDTTRDALVGGFSGGEVGLRSFVSTGEVPFLPPGERRSQQSPLLFAGVAAAAAVVGGILLTDVGDLGERALSGSTPVSPAALAPLSENTKLLLEVAVLLVGVVGSVVGGRALVGSLTNGIKESAARLATLAVFWMVVFVAAKIVIDG